FSTAQESDSRSNVSLATQFFQQPAKGKNASGHQALPPFPHFCFAQEPFGEFSRLGSIVNLKRVAYHIGVVSDDCVRLRKRISDNQKRDKIGIVILEFD